jgi:hypothetical protein
MKKTNKVHYDESEIIQILDNDCRLSYKSREIIAEIIVDLTFFQKDALVEALKIIAKGEQK